MVQLSPDPDKPRRTWNILIWHASDRGKEGILQHANARPRGCSGLRIFSSVVGGSPKPIPRLIIAAVAGALCLTAQPGLALSPKVLDSVVSVLPDWPGYERKEAGQTKPWEEPEGTAVAIMPGGYLVTNLHVIRRAVRVTVRRYAHLGPDHLRGAARVLDAALSGPNSAPSQEAESAESA